jgi:hypothetical protein
MAASPSLGSKQVPPKRPKAREAMNIDQHMLQALGTGTAGRRPVTIGDFARQFGLSSAVVRTVARRLVDSGLAAPSMVDVHGVQTLRGLLPLPADGSA